MAMDSCFCVSALEELKPLVFNTDISSQYISNNVTEMLKENSI